MDVSAMGSQGRLNLVLLCVLVFGMGDRSLTHSLTLLPFSLFPYDVSWKVENSFIKEQEREQSKSHVSLLLAYTSYITPFFITI